MPSYFHLMVGIGGTALVIGVMALWLHEPQPPSSLSAGSTSSSMSRMVGSSALSHGGPSPNSKIAANFFPARFHMGQKAIVADADTLSHTIPLLPLPPGTPISSSTPGETRAVPPGAVVVVIGMQTVEPAATQTEQYYEVRIPDGTKGWLSERVLRRAVNGD